jgi:hypothetical protein
MRSDSIPMTQPMYKLHHKLLNANVLKTVSSPLLLIDTYTQQNFMPTQSGKKIDLFYTCDRFYKNDFISSPGRLPGPVKDQYRFVRWEFFFDNHLS